MVEMTDEEAIHKLEYSKKAYQTLIDEKVDSGKLVGDGVRGEWKAETLLDEAYKSMIEALDIAIQALEQQPCEDCISREVVDDYITNLLSGYLYEEERTRLEDLTAYIWELPSVTPKYTDEEIDKAQAVEQAYVDKIVELAVEETKRPTARWEKFANDYKKCSRCEELVRSYRNYKYCPACGARMTESEDKE